MNLKLRHHIPGESLSFDWDPSTGELSGPDADRAADLLAQAGDRVRLPGGWPAIETPDARHNRASFAAVFLSRGYELPPELHALIVLPDDDTPAGAVN